MLLGTGARTGIWGALRTVTALGITPKSLLGATAGVGDTGWIRCDMGLVRFGTGEPHVYEDRVRFE